MSTNVDCPTCSRRLRVTDELLGKSVKCPSCGGVFTADVEGTPPSPAPPRPPEEQLPVVKSRRRYDEDDDDDDYDRRPRRRRRRRYLQPHRGQLIMILGILSFVVAGLILGPIAWILGNADLKEIREGRMDPEGESQTSTGRICGMVSTIIHLGGLVVCGVGMVVYFVFIVAIIGASAASAPPPGQQPMQPPNFGPPPQRRPFGPDQPLRLGDYLPRLNMSARPPLGEL
jgi:predicted Zn finger-like uncharacterized protein